ncbi:hypothetical protein RF11_08420 [Thelohanellus kitauei]|uniref:Uncharacterized protein n=1 Tax=Thelohanellus kitauei TaxID=669202 RepID=A0A0C2MFA2_THEKT|nr:hypothetical protein RF11_08420 [Thelohanellus kitauei]
MAFSSSCKIAKMSKKVGTILNTERTLESNGLGGAILLELRIISFVDIFSQTAECFICLHSVKTCLELCRRRPYETSLPKTFENLQASARNEMKKRSSTNR